MDRGRKTRTLVSALAVVVIALMVLLMVGVIGGWLGLRIAAYRGEDKLQQTLKAIAATGAPVKLSQLAKPPVPDAENAALVYQKAFEALRFSDADRQVVADLRNGKSTLDDPATAARAKSIVTRNAQALRLIERATTMPRCDFRLDWAKGFSLTFPQFAKLRACSRLLSLESLVLAHAGRLDEALAVSAANLRLSNATREPCIIGVLVQYAIIRITSDSLAAILKDSQPSPSACASLARQIGGMDMYGPYVDALKGERVSAMAIFEQVRTSPHPLETIAEFSGQGSASGAQSRRGTPGSFWRWMFAADELTYLDLMDQVIKQAPLPYRKLAGIHPSIEERVESLRGWPPRILTAIFMPVYERSQAARDKAIARLDLDRLALLLKAYRGQHGRYPGSLRELPGMSGTGMPLDPFSGGPYIYRRQGEGFLVYSWGPNLKDDGGVPPPPKNLDGGDIVFECRR